MKIMEQKALAEKLSPGESNTTPQPSLLRRLHYWWSLSVAGALLLILGPPILLVARVTGRRELVYPWAIFGGKNWLRLSGMKVFVKGLEALEPKETYVFIANHKSYLDTATLFVYAGRRIGFLAKKELLKVPVLGYGMSFVNIMAIDRSNAKRARETTEAATARIKSGVSFAIFAEGTRARPGELLPFKKGAFHMAVAAQVPIVPVAIKNTDLLMGKGTGQAKAGTIEVLFLSPIPTAGLSSRNVPDLTARVHSAIARELSP